ncbi:hypothetical protein GOV09_07120 [Candidatus Woesearchaeota archaeon]|nr:hypothetical protein [Candidatus Woesearchaeota archaeon]
MDQMPVFVRIHDPSEINQLVDELRNAIHETREILTTIDGLSKQEAEKIDAWRSNFAETRDKISVVTNTLLEPERI